MIRHRDEGPEWNSMSRFNSRTGSVLTATPTPPQTAPSAKSPATPPSQLLTVAEIHELSRVDAIVNLQRWWKHRRRHNHERIAELVDLLRVHTESLILKKRQSRIRAKIRDIALHMLFLCVYSVSCHRGYANEHLFRLVAATSNAYRQSTVAGNFDAIDSPSDLYTWLRGTFVPVTYASSSGGMLLTNHVVGGVRFGQLRVASANCTTRVSSYFTNATLDDSDTSHTLYCYGSSLGDFATSDEVTTAIGSGTIPFAGLNGTDTTTERSEFFSSMTTSNTKTLPAPAYSVVLPRADHVEATRIIDTLESLQYVDLHTRAVMVDVNLYNAMLQYLMAVRFLIEFPSSGGAVTSISVNTAPLTKSFLIDPDDLWWTACNLGVQGFYLYFLMSEIALQGTRRRRRHLRSGKALRWSSRNGSVLRMISLLLYVIVWLMRLFTLLKMPTSLPLFRDSEYIRLRPFTEAFRISQALLGLNTCICWWILIVLLRVLTHVDLFLRTVEIASRRLVTLLLCLTMLLYGYASSFLIGVGAQSARYRSIPQAMASLVMLLFGTTTSSSVGYSTVEMLLFACFLVLNAFIVSNLFLVVMWDAFRRACDDVDRLAKSNDQFNLPLETWRYVREVIETVSMYITAGWKYVVSKLQRKSTNTSTDKPMMKRKSVVHAISSSRMVTKSKRLIAGQVDALSGLGDKFVKNVAKGLGEHDRDLLIERGDNPHGSSTLSDSRRGEGGEGSVHTKLMQGMLLQLALQNENLQRALEELRRELADMAKDTVVSQSTGIPTGRRASVRPPSTAPSRQPRATTPNQPDHNEEDEDEDEDEDEVVSLTELTAIQSI